MDLQIITILVLAAGIGLILYFQTRKPKADQSMQMMLQLLESLQKRVDSRLGENTKALSESISQTNKNINERLDNAARVIGSLQKELGSMREIGPDIRRLSEVLASPKARGNFGEEMLEQLIRQVLPSNVVEFQYRFRSGEIVDAIIRIGERILPIDSKFSLENFRLYKEAKTEDAAADLKKSFLRDVKKRIDEIAKKYILQQEGTFDFAFMYVPSEGVFSEILEDATINSYAREKNVILVSPNNLYHQLRLTLTYLSREKINRVAHELLSMIKGIRQEGDKFGRNLDVLANHLKNAGNTMGVVSNDFVKLKSTINNAANLELEGQPVEAASKLIENK
ncbi:MAG: DNA recombination protein RmuC [bacterium]|nr:DNA recombination protein RmuC [bacterium]